MTPEMPGWFRWLLVPHAAVGATAAAGLPLVAVALAAAALLVYAALGLSSAALAIVLVARWR